MSKGRVTGGGRRGRKPGANDRAKWGPEAAAKRCAAAGAGTLALFARIAMVAAGEPCQFMWKPPCHSARNKTNVMRLGKRVDHVMGLADEGRGAGR